MSSSRKLQFSHYIVTSGIDTTFSIHYETIKSLIDRCSSLKEVLPLCTFYHLWYALKDSLCDQDQSIQRCLSFSSSSLARGKLGSVWEVQQARGKKVVLGRLKVVDSKSGAAPTEGLGRCVEEGWWRIGCVDVASGKRVHTTWASMVLDVLSTTWTSIC